MSRVCLLQGPSPLVLERLVYRGLSWNRSNQLQWKEEIAVFLSKFVCTCNMWHMSLGQVKKQECAFLPCGNCHRQETFVFLCQIRKSILRRSGNNVLQGSNPSRPFPSLNQGTVQKGRKMNIGLEEIEGLVKRLCKSKVDRTSLLAKMLWLSA